MSIFKECLYGDSLAEYLDAGWPVEFTVEDYIRGHVLEQLEQNAQDNDTEATQASSKTEEATKPFKKSFTDSESAVFRVAENSGKFNSVQNTVLKLLYNKNAEVVPEMASEQELAASSTSLLHLVCYRALITPSDIALCTDMAEELLTRGLAYNAIDCFGNTPGCVLSRGGLKNDLYWKLVSSGVAAEMLMRKLKMFSEAGEDSEDDEEDDEEEEEKVEEKEKVETESTQGNEDNSAEAQDKGETNEDNDVKDAHVSSTIKDTLSNLPGPATDQDIYLKTKLTYSENALVTDEKDGVMMDWETEIMRLGAQSLMRGLVESEDPVPEYSVLNVGFGMGIIDTFIQEIAAKYPDTVVNHYICEPHPDVLEQMKKNGWFEKKNVKILAGRWQDELDKLLQTGEVFFEGVYYDTFSEYYEDFAPQFVDVIVGLLAPEGVLSFFNGFGADREFVYDMYKEIVKMDLAEYGFDIKYSETLARGKWDGVKRSYWDCNVYYHPEVKFS